MKNTDPSTAQQLDTQLAIQDLKRRSRLWQMAQGQFGWRGAIAILLPLLLIAVGVGQRIDTTGFQQFMRDLRGSGTGFMVIGLALLLTYMWSFSHAQQQALAELVKQLERNRA